MDATASRSRTSQFSKSIFGHSSLNHARLRSAPARERLSSTVTFQPRFANLHAECTPMKPAPPVISTENVLGTRYFPLENLLVYLQRLPDVAIPAEFAGVLDTFGDLLSTAHWVLKHSPNSVG